MDEETKQNHEDCPKGGKHKWGTDGHHQNRFCLKCFRDWNGEYVDPYPGWDEVIK